MSIHASFLLILQLVNVFASVLAIHWKALTVFYGTIALFIFYPIPKPSKRSWGSLTFAVHVSLNTHLTDEMQMRQEAPPPPPRAASSASLVLWSSSAGPTPAGTALPEDP